MAIPQTIKDLANKVRTAVYGKDVRESLAKSMEETGNLADETKTRQDSLETQFQSVLDETTGKDVVSAPEILAARVDSEGINHSNLKERLDQKEAEFASLMAQRVQIQQETETYKIPGDFLTLQDAVDKLSEKKTKQGKIFVLLIEAGHQLTKGVYVENGDYGHFKIQSEDVIAQISDSFTSNNLIAGNHSVLPTLSCVIDMKGLKEVGYYAYRSSTGHVENGCGVINAGTHGIECRGSRVYAEQTVWTGAGDTAVRIEQTGIVNVQSADLSNAGNRGLYVSRGSMANFMWGTAKDCGVANVMARRSKVNVHQAILTGAGQYGIVAYEGCQISADGSDVSNSVQYGVYADATSHVDFRRGVASNCGTRGISSQRGSTVNACEATVQSSTGVYDIEVVHGANVIATNCITRSSADSNPVESDTNVSIFNITTGNGIIYDANKSSVIRSGEANGGHYIRFADGTQIAFKTVNFDTTTSALGAITSPAPSWSGLRPYASVSFHGTGTDMLNLLHIAVGTESNGNWIVRCDNTKTNGATIPLALVMTGRWR